jgi:potassium efflux system protein
MFLTDPALDPLSVPCHRKRGASSGSLRMWGGGERPGGGAGIWTVWLLLWLLLAPFGRPATPAPAPIPPSTPELIRQLESRMEEARAELGLATGLELNPTNLPPGATPIEFREYRLAMQLLIRTYRKHVEDLVSTEAAREQQRDLEKEIQSWRGFSEPAPYSSLFVDELRDSVCALESKEKAMANAAEILVRLQGSARETLEKTEAQLRQLSEQLERGKSGTEVVRITWQRTLAQTRHRVAAAGLASLEARQGRNGVDLAACQQELAFVRRKLTFASQDVRFAQTDLDRVLETLDRRLQSLQAEYSTLETQNAQRQRELASAREELRRILSSTPEISTNRASTSGGLDTLQEQVRLRAVQADTSAEHLRVVGQLMDVVMSERGLWQMRFNAVGTTDPEIIQNAYRRVEQLAGVVQLGKSYFSQQANLAARQIAEQQSRLQNQVQGQAALAVAGDLIESYRQREQLHDRVLRSLEGTERLLQRWKAAFEQDRRALPWTARMRDLFSSFSSFARNVWAFELYVAEDTITVDGQRVTGRRGVTVGKIVMAVSILVVGFLLARLCSRSIERLVVRRFALEPNQASLIRRWAMVAFGIVLILFSLVSVKIPLTVFAFAGGALAIGVGFGTQNLLKNFISGIIILFERPFRIGDVLAIGGSCGKVVAIGIRSSVLQLWDSTETLIPNSALLENNVTNWTYSDTKVRFSLRVGVAYGSDTRRVAQLLSEVAERHGLVQKEPAAQVLFQDFADSSLVFELRFWVDVLKHNSAQISSDLRHMIVVAFADQRISISFPQRDLHLDTLRPLAVQLVPPGEDKSPVGEAPPQTAPIP